MTGDVGMDFVCFLISATIFALALGFTIVNLFKSKNKVRFFKPFYVLITGVFLSITVLFIPMNYPMFEDHSFAPLVTVLSSVHTAIRFFIVDCDFELVLTGTVGMSALLKQCYLVFASILYVISPLLTASIALSFFENISAWFRFRCAFFRDTYIFSELNTRSISLAYSLKHSNPKRLIIFTDVFDDNDENSYELIDHAKKLDAILFKKDITIINFKKHSKKTKLHFFIIGNDEIENINQAVILASPASSDKNFISNPSGKHTFSYDFPRGDTRIFIFSTKGSIEQYLSAIHPKHLKLRRINDVQSLVYKILYDDGMQIFNSAVETGNTVYNTATKQDDPEKKISAVILGVDHYGTEMIKALTWFSQMHPYKLEINAFDKEKNSDLIFASGYPDLFDINPAKEKLPEPEKDENGNYKVYPFRNGDYYTPGESHYKISIHTKENFDTSEFDNKFSKITDASYIFISLGDDDTNIRIATKIRILLKRMNLKNGTPDRSPVIHTIVHNPLKKDMLINGRTAAGTSYDIRPYGDIASTYSEACVLNSEVEDQALARHLKYVYRIVESEGLTGEERQSKIAAEEETFWRYDYNYRSSIASAIHSKFKKECDIPGSKKQPSERTEDENVFYRIMEHQRWNAYVRSEGYVFFEKRDKSAKTHHLLVPFDDLPYEEQIKDDD